MLLKKAATNDEHAIFFAPSTQFLESIFSVAGSSRTKYCTETPSKVFFSTVSVRPGQRVWAWKRRLPMFMHMQSGLFQLLPTVLALPLTVAH